MLQRSALHRTYARPAAAQARPGTWPACALEPREPGFPVANIGKADGAGRGSAMSGTAIHRGGIFGQDRRYGDNQRGRAVACA